jgi:hypothetical protein
VPVRYTREKRKSESLKKEGEMEYEQVEEIVKKTGERASVRKMEGKRVWGKEAYGCSKQWEEEEEEEEERKREKEEEEG